MIAISGEHKRRGGRERRDQRLQQVEFGELTSTLKSGT